MESVTIRCFHLGLRIVFDDDHGLGSYFTLFPVADLLD